MCDVVILEKGEVMRSHHTREACIAGLFVHVK